VQQAGLLGRARELVAAAGAARAAHEAVAAELRQQMVEV
jgi:hypothetical protein